MVKSESFSITYVSLRRNKNNTISLPQGRTEKIHTLWYIFKALDWFKDSGATHPVLANIPSLSEFKQILSTYSSRELSGQIRRHDEFLSSVFYPHGDRTKNKAR